MKNTLNITKGVWVVNRSKKPTGSEGKEFVYETRIFTTDENYDTIQICKLLVPFRGLNPNPPLDEIPCNALLIAEAGTVANETGKTPRQLADSNKELLEALISIRDILEQAGHLLWIEHAGINNAIKNAQ